MNKKYLIQTAQLKILLLASNSVILTSSALALILSYMQRHLIASSIVIAWLSIVLAIAFIRSVFISALKNSPFNNPSTNLIKFRIGVVVSGLGWGSAGIVMFPAHDMQHQLFLIFILAGLSAGSVISYSADLFSAVGYSLSVITPLLLRLIVMGDTYSLTMSMAVSLYLIFMIANAKNYHFKQKENIILNIEAAEHQQRLDSKTEWHHATLAGTMDGYWLVNLDGSLLEVNENYSRMSGYTMQELLKMRVADLEATETAMETASHIKKIKDIGQDRFESKHRRKDGTIFEVEISAQYRFIEGGQFVVFLRDVTEKNQTAAKLALAQVALGESLERYRDLYEFAPVAYVTLDYHGVITQVNWKATSLFGVSRKQLFRKKFEEFVISDQKSLWINSFESMNHLDDGEETSFRLNLCNSDGSIFIATINCLRTDDAKDQSMLSITLTEITKLNQMIIEPK